MSPVRSPFLLIVFVAMLAMMTALSCGRIDRDESRSLSLADSLIEIDPDSSLALLTKIDVRRVDDLWGRADQALYGLLLTQAAVKVDSTAWIDSARIASSAEWFDSHGPAFNRLRSLFYLSYAEMLAKLYSSSMTHAMQALEEAKKIGDDYWLAKCYEQISLLMGNNGLRRETIPYTKQAAHYYNKVGKDANYRWMLGDLGLDYSNSNELDSAVGCLKQVIKLDIEASDTIHAAICMSYMVCRLVLSQRYAEATYWLSEYEKLDPEIHEDAMFIGCKAALKIDELDDDEFHKLIDKAKRSKPNSYDMYVIHSATRDYYIKKDSIEKSIIYCDSMILSVFNWVDKALSQSVVVGQRDYAIQNMRLLQLERERSLLVQCVIGLIVIFLGVISVGVVKLRFKQRRMELERKVEEVLNLTHELERERAKNDLFIEDKTRDDMLYSHLKRTLQRYFYNRWDVLNKLCAEYYERGSSQKTREMIVKELESQIQELSSQEMRDEIEEKVNECFDGIVKRLRDQCTFLSEKDIHFITLVFSGLSPKTVSLLTNNDVKYFYTRRTRLIARIEKSEAADKSEFIHHLSIKGGNRTPKSI